MDRHASLRGRRRRLIILYAVVCAPFIGYGAWRALQTNSNSPLTWVPPSFAPRAAYDRFVEQFGTGEVVVASWPECRVDRPELDDLLTSLRDDPAFTDADGHSYFERIICGRELVDRLTHGPYAVPRKAAVNRFRGSLIGPDGRQTCMVIAFAPAGLNDRDRLIREIVARICDRCDVDRRDVHLAGPVIDGWTVDRAGKASLSQLAIPSAIIMFLLAFVCLGTLRDAVIVFGLSVVCQAITLALVHYSGEPMNALLIILPPLIQVLAIAGGVHLTNYYVDSLPEHGPHAAPSRAVRLGWLPCLLSSGTTALGIGSLMASRLTPIHTFGVFGAAGVLLVFGLLMLVVPALWQMWPRRLAGESEHASSADRTPVSTIATNAITRLWPAVLVGGFAAMAGCGYFLKDLNTSVHVETLFPRDSRILRDYRRLEDRIGPMATIDVVVSWPQESRTPAVSRMKRLWDVQKAVASMDDVGGSLSALQLLPALPPRSRMPPDAYNRTVTAMIDGNRSAFERAGFLSEDGRRQRWRISARVSATAGTDYRAVLDRLREVVKPETAGGPDAGDIEVEYTGVMPLVHEVQQQLLRDLLWSFLGALAVITMVMTLAQGGLCAGVIAMIPNVFPIVVLFGVLGWWKLPVDIGTVMTAGVALGIAVDDTLHFLTFFQRANRDGHNRADSVRYAYRHCAKAMIQTSVICGVGLLIFVLAEFLPTSRFAWMVSAMILLALIGDLCLLPALLLSPLGRFLGQDPQAAPKSDAGGCGERWENRFALLCTESDAMISPRITPMGTDGFRMAKHGATTARKKPNLAHLRADGGLCNNPPERNGFRSLRGLALCDHCRRRGARPLLGAKSPGRAAMEFTTTSRRDGFTILELLVVIAVVGVLLALALPAVQQAREAARNQQCMYNLRQIGIALHSYHEVHGTLPAGWRFARDGRTAFGWGSSVLPHVEQGGLPGSLDFGRSFATIGNAGQPAETPGVFLCPSDFGNPTFALFAETESHHESQQGGTRVLATLPRANFVGVFGNSDPDDVSGRAGEGAFIASRGLRFRDLRRGLSQVVLVGERTTRKLPSTWLGFDARGEDAEGRVTGALITGPNRGESDECEFDSRHDGHVNFLWGDGHVSNVANGVDRAVYRAFGCRE